MFRIFAYDLLRRKQQPYIKLSNLSEGCLHVPNGCFKFVSFDCSQNYQMWTYLLLALYVTLHVID